MPAPMSPAPTMPTRCTTVAAAAQPFRQLSRLLIAEEDADEISGRRRQRQPPGGLPFLHETRLAAGLHPHADRLQSLRRGRHVIRHSRYAIAGSRH